VDPPAKVASVVVHPIAAPEQPVPAAIFVLDPIIVPDGPDLCIAPPPFAMDAFGSVAGDDAVSCAAPFEAAGRLIGKECYDAP